MNIYIANLSYDVNDQDLKDLFEEFGKVSSAKVITDKMSGKSRGFGFVEMDDNTEGQKAIQELDKCEYDGKVINVTVAKPRTDRNTSGGFQNRRSNSDYNSNRRSFRS
ncbi:MAG TPA: RNA-binding protein [Bacteroidales bacterium]|jgi:RNA recognition motif-containing protein|nr:RNA-binding protein [Bacteroidales bacterium]